jgi:hypothetical protein
MRNKLKGGILKMKVYGAFIDLRNVKQVHWWNVANLFVKAIDRTDVVDKATGRTVGCIFKITGLFAKYVASKNNTFIKNPVKVKF